MSKRADRNVRPTACIAAANPFAQRTAWKSVLLCICLVLVGCRDEAPALPTVPIQIGNRTFTLEIAANDANRQKGLMDRDHMPIDRGMIFAFSDEAPRAFWMKNTRIPLDILYIDASGKIVDIKSMQPLDLRSSPSTAPAKFAIELNQGAAKLCGAKIGDVLSIPPNVRDTSD